MSRARATRLLIPALGAAAITLLLLLPPVSILESYDLPRMHQCYKYDFRAMVLAGEAPWWNPYTALGRPFFADVETATLYPPSWLVIPLGVSAGIVAMVWLHLALAIAGTRRLAERLGVATPYAAFAGFAFALSGALLARIESGQLHLFCVVCLWPFLWDAFLRLQDNPGRRTLVAAASWLALTFLAGSPPLLWCGVIGMAALVAGRETTARSALRTGLWCSAALALAGALVAVQLLSFVELVQQGNRPLGDTEFALIGGVSGTEWLSLLVPPGPWLAISWESNLHVSLIFVGLAVALALTKGKQPGVRALVLVVVVGLVLASGDQTPVLPALARWVPGFSGLRYPGRYGLMSALAIVVLACLALSHWVGQNQKRRFVGGIIIAAQIAVSVVGIFGQQHIFPPPAPARYEARIRSDLVTERMPRDGAPPRSALPVSLQRADSGAQSGTSTLAGFNNPALARTWQTLYLLAGESAPRFHRAEVPDEILLKAALYAGYFSLSVIPHQKNLSILYRDPIGPRTFLSFQPQTVARWQDAVEKIHAGHDFNTSALVETAVPGVEPAGTGTARIIRFARNQVTVESEADRSGLLVLAEAWYPGWRARVDGLEHEVLPANGWMRAVVVPAGHHTIEFHYTPRWLLPGLAVTVIALLTSALLWRHSSSSHVVREA